MCGFLNASEISEVIVKYRISGFPSSVKNILSTAKRENWVSRKRNGRGGGIEFEVASLPTLLRIASEKYLTWKLSEEVRQEQEAEFELADELAVIKTAGTQKSRANPKGLPTVHRPEDTQLSLNLDDPNEAVKHLNQQQKDCAEARCAIVQDVLSIGETLKFSQKQSVAYFLEQMREGVLPERIAQLIPIANARSNSKREVSARTLQSWIIQFKTANATMNARLLALAPKATNFERSPLEESWLMRFAKIHRVPQKPKLAHSYEKFARQWLADGLPEDELPSLDAVRRAWKKLPPSFCERGRHTGQQYLSLLPYVKRDWHVLEPNQVWIIDGHSFKARVKHFEHGQPFVPEITFIVDGCTRKIVGFSIALAESSKAVADAIRIALRHGGLPVLIYSDNGKGETGRDITGELTGICPRLDIQHTTGIEGRAQGRGIIEGLWDVTTIKLAKDYPTFHGKDMDKSAGHLMYRKTESWAKAERDGKLLTDEQLKYKAKMPTFNQFLADLLAVIDEYNHTPHSEHPKKDDGKHYTPTEYWDFRMAQVPIDERPEILSEEELQLLERSMEERTVQRGWIQFNNQHYFSMELANLNGEKVLIAYDWDKPQDIGVYHKDGRFICMAQLNGNQRAAFDDVKSMAQTQREKRAKRQIVLKRNQIKRLEMDVKGGNVIENTPDFAQLVAPNVPANDVIVPKEVEILDVEVVETPPKRSKYAF